MSALALQSCYGPPFILEHFRLIVAESVLRH